MAKRRENEDSGGTRNAKARDGEDGGAGGRSVLMEWVRTGVAAFIIYLILKTFLVQTFVITSSSMEETLLVGDFLILSKAAYGAKIPFTEARLPGYTEPARGDVVVFRPPHDPDLDVVKRLMGLPGDTLFMEDKQLYVNGEPLEEPYTRYSDPDGDVGHPWMRWQCGERVALSPDISGSYRVPAEGTNGRGDCDPTRDNWGPIVVPDGMYFLMGDNRDDSVDSRYWGYLDETRLIGETVIIYYSYDAEQLAPFPWITEIRPGRIGDVIR